MKDLLIILFVICQAVVYGQTDSLNTIQTPDHTIANGWTQDTTVNGKSSFKEIYLSLLDPYRFLDPKEKGKHFYTFIQNVPWKK